MTWRSSVPLRVLPASVGVLLLAGCGSTQAPAASHVEIAPAPSPPSVSSVTPAPKSGSTLASLEPCSLLSPVDRSTAGLSSLGQDKTIGASRACDWTEPGSFGVTITLDGSSGLSELSVAKGTSRKIKVGTHAALQVADKKAADGTCAVLLGVGDSASAQVDVSNTNFTGTDLACRRAGTVAGLIEPKLPGSS
jgi:hypothetical protein